MNSIVVKRYSAAAFEKWNAFINGAIQPNFLFHRTFMEYHSDRFEDHSLLLFKKEKLIAVLPANRVKETLHTHQGLSYGGLIFQEVPKFELLIDLFKSLCKYCTSTNIHTINYKLEPLVYGGLVTQSVQHLLFILGAVLYRSDSYLVFESTTYKPNRNRLRAIKKATTSNKLSLETNRYDLFWNKVLIPNLESRFNVSPVHTLAEITALSQAFPDNIHCFTVHDEENIKAGVVIFENDNIAHFQYSAGTDSRNEDGALDFLFHEVCQKFLQKKIISFGSCTNGNNGRLINKGLLYWKESFGAINIPQSFYKIDLQHIDPLNEVFN